MGAIGMGEGWEAGVRGILKPIVKYILGKENTNV